MEKNTDINFSSNLFFEPMAKKRDVSNSLDNREINIDEKIDLKESNSQMDTTKTTTPTKLSYNIGKKGNKCDEINSNTNNTNNSNLIEDNSLS